MLKSSSARNAMCALAAFFVTTVFGAESPSDSQQTMAQNSSVKVTRAEFEAEIQRIPAELRAEFLMSNKRVGDLLVQMLLRKTLAAQARGEKLDADPVNAARVSNETDRALAQLRIARVEEIADAAFEAKRASYIARAREIYTVDRDHYRAPDEISASHIFFDTKKHSSDEARKLAVEAHAKIVSGADFNATAKQVSEDPSAKENSGRLGWFTRDRMDPAFSRAAFALKKPGDVSDPVQSAFGWHIIRLDERRAPRIRSFEEVQDEIVASLKTTYINEQREAVLNTVRSDPATAINDSAVKALLDQTMTAPQHSHTPADKGSSSPAIPPK
jgi:peptidyl-prolyl cis-trans isomerase C